MRHPRLQVSALGLLLLAALFPNARGAIWPLAGYEACGSDQPTTALGGPWANGTTAPPTPTGVALDGDNDLLWAIADGTLYKYRYSDGSLLSTFDLESPGAGAAGRRMLHDEEEESHYSVTLAESGQVAVANGKDAVIRVLSSDPATHEISPVEDIELSFVPLSITYDAAYERFYATNAFPSLSATDFSTIPPGTMIIQVDQGETELLFEVDYTNLLMGNSISDIHYSSNTGTFFILCSECNGVFEVTKSGSLRSFDTSAFEIPDSPQAPAALSLARTGNVMLILRDEMVLDSFCQEFIPSLPVLPSIGPYLTVNQTWYPIDTYVFCGFSEYTEIDTDDVTGIVLDPATSTNWLLVGGKLREYDWTGNLLRELNEARLAELGLAGITSMTFFKPRKLLLGIQTGNRLVVLDTAPEEYTPESDDEEPPGPDGNAEFIRQINLAEVIEEYTIDDPTFPSDSLGSIFYVTTEKAILYSPVDQKSVFRAQLGETGDLVVVGQSVDIESLDVALYSPVQNSYLMWCNSCSKLVQVNVKPEIAEAEKSFFTGGDAAGMTMTPDGNVMILTTTSGAVNYFCGNAIDSNGVITRSVSGEDPDVNPLYFWQLQQLQQAETGEVANVADRSFPLDFQVPFSTLFGVSCADANYFVWPASVDTFGFCEDKCQSLLECNAFTWDFTLKTCVLKKTCYIQQPSATSVSGVKQQTFFAPPPVAVSPSPPPPPPVVTVTGSFDLFPTVSCNDPSLGLPISGATSQMCQAACASSPQCGAFTSHNGCFLKTGCTDISIVPGATSGIKKGGAVAPPSVPSPPPVAPGAWDIISSMGCKDPNLGNKIAAVSQQGCQDQCQANPQCMAFTHNDKNDCFLKATCNSQQFVLNDVSGLKPGAGQLVVASVSVALADSGEGFSLIDGWAWDGKQDCTPWLNPECGHGANPGIKVGDITWYRMFAHKANPIKHGGDGTMEWTPYRMKDAFGSMYTKGSEIMGYFDEPISVANKGDVASVTFLWASDGHIQDICGKGVASEIDCNKCEDIYTEEVDFEQYFYWEARCFGGTGDFRVALLDTSKGERVTKDGYGYFNPKVTQYRGFQWRFHPQACPEVGSDKLGPKEYDATAATSWYRNSINEDWLNSQGLTCDFIEGPEKKPSQEKYWYPALGQTRSFEKRLYKYADDGECLNLANGEFTPEDKPFKLTLTNLGPLEFANNDDDDDNDGPLVKFNWKMEFNGWSRDQDDTIPAHLFPSLIDGIAIGYTNPSYFKKLKLKRVA